MQEKRKINKSHPKYPEYITKCNALWDRYKNLMDAEEAKYPYPKWRGQDNPAGIVNRQLNRQFNAELKILQEEYSFLFEKIINA